MVLRPLLDWWRAHSGVGSDPLGARRGTKCFSRWSWPENIPRLTKLDPKNKFRIGIQNNIEQPKIWTELHLPCIRLCGPSASGHGSPVHGASQSAADLPGRSLARIAAREDLAPRRAQGPKVSERRWNERHWSQGRHSSIYCRVRWCQIFREGYPWWSLHCGKSSIHRSQTSGWTQTLPAKSSSLTSGASISPKHLAAKSLSYRGMWPCSDISWRLEMRVVSKMLFGDLGFEFDIWTQKLLYIYIYCKMLQDI